MPRLAGQRLEGSGRASSSDGRERLFFIRIGLFLLAVILVARLFQLQIREGSKWTALAQEQHTLSQALIAERGNIIMRDGETLSSVAINREYQLVYAVPRTIEDVAGTANQLAEVLHLDAKEITTKIGLRHDDPFEIIKKRVTEEEQGELKKLKLKGVYFLPETYRYYPANELAAKVIGYAASGDGGETGIYGVEASYNAELRGENGNLFQEKDAAGRWISLSDRDHVEAVDGKSIVLTIDRVIQYEVERILAKSLEDYNADQISAIVMEPKTGKILAMAALPQFNPNDYGQVSDYSRFMNPTISLPYEPGSVLKPITMAMGIESGKVNAETEYVDTGSVSEAGYTIRNAEDKVYGKSSMIKVLDESINTGVIYVERLIGNSAFREYLSRFGFGEKTGIRLPAENTGNIRNLSNERATLPFMTASFGQGISVTPLQLTLSYAALANGGVLMEPQLVDRFIHSDGTVESVPSQVVRRVVSQETATTMGRMLRDVVVNGHGKRADVPGYLVGGKTGTAQVAKTDGKGYEDDDSIGSFAGYAPINDPQYVVLIKVDHPKDVQWAESSAAPTFGAIMQFLLSYGKVQPTEKLTTK